MSSKNTVDADRRAAALRDLDDIKRLFDKRFEEDSGDASMFAGLVNPDQHGGGQKDRDGEDNPRKEEPRSVPVPVPQYIAPPITKASGIEQGEFLRAFAKGHHPDLAFEEFEISTGRLGKIGVEARRDGNRMDVKLRPYEQAGKGWLRTNRRSLAERLGKDLGVEMTLSVDEES